MKKSISRNFLLGLLFSLALTNCTSLSRSIKESNTLVELKKEDFTLTDQVYGTAKQVKVLGVDWNRIIRKQKAKTVLTPLIGINIYPNKVESYALYDMLNANQGYDVVFYPYFERSRFKVLFLYSKTEVTVKARLGKLKS